MGDGSASPPGGARTKRGAQRWTIGHELTLIVLAVLLPFAALGAYWAFEDYRAEQAAIQSRALRLAQDLGDEVDQFLSDTASLVEALARVPSVKRGEQPQADQLLRELAAKQSFYESLFVLDPTGRVIALGGDELPPPANRQSYLQRTLSHGATVITDPIPLRSQGRHVFLVATPVWDEDGLPIGIVAISVNLLRFQDGLRQVDLPDDSSLLIVDSQGRIVARRTEPERWVGEPAAGVPVVRDALRLREGTSEGEGVDGRRRLNGFAPVSHVSWHVIVGIPIEQADGALGRELRRTVSRLLAAGVVAGVAAWLLSQRLTGPVGNLTATARAIAAGDLSYRADEAGPSEVQTLGRTLNRMTAALERQLDELRDAQERERIAGERSLAELRRLHSEFIAVAAHELRTPVAAAKSYAELLQRDEAGEVALTAETRQQVLARLDGVCDRLARLVRSLLGASRIQAGGLELDGMPFDLMALVVRVSEEHAAANPNHLVRLRTRPLRLASALGDADRTEDVLVNLLVNATRYSPPGSSVFVDVLEDERWVEVAVTDQGPGVPEEEQHAVFERFHRGKAAGGSGVGLGLYIARAYVEAMGGEIGVRSTPGAGACFWFRLPRPHGLTGGNPAAGAASEAGLTRRSPGTTGHATRHEAAQA